MPSTPASEKRSYVELMILLPARAAGAGWETFKAWLLNACTPDYHSEN